ncbi:MAG: phosphodiesterase [Pseudomonadota bacterium]
MTTIVQLSDTHITEPGRLAYGRVDTHAALARAVTHINALPDRIGPIDAVVLSGDLADRATAAEYDAFRALTAPLRPPLLAIPGNHDNRDLMRACLAAGSGKGVLEHNLTDDGPLNWSVAIGALRVIGLDTSVPGAAHGMLDDATLDWLEAELTAHSGTPALIFTHHPPFESGIGHMDRIGLRNATALLTRLAAHANVRLVASGHVHRMIVAAGTPLCMMAPAPAHAVSLDQSAEAAATFTLEPGAVLIHRWAPAEGQPFGRLQSQLSHIGDFEGPFPFSAST